jgi:hypothetical protein
MLAAGVYEQTMNIRLNADVAATSVLREGSGRTSSVAELHVEDVPALLSAVPGGLLTGVKPIAG